MISSIAATREVMIFLYPTKALFLSNARMDGGDGGHSRNVPISER